MGLEGWGWESGVGNVGLGDGWVGGARSRRAGRGRLEG